MQNVQKFFVFIFRKSILASVSAFLKLIKSIQKRETLNLPIASLCNLTNLSHSEFHYEQDEDLDHVRDYAVLESR